jgi:hypothetical protein
MVELLYVLIAVAALVAAMGLYGGGEGPWAPH